jgi:hypothetical protein
MINLNISHNNNKLVAFDPNMAVSAMADQTIKSDIQHNHKHMKHKAFNAHIQRT